MRARRRSDGRPGARSRPWPVRSRRPRRRAARPRSPRSAPTARRGRPRGCTARAWQTRRRSTPPAAGAPRRGGVAEDAGARLDERLDLQVASTSKAGDAPAGGRIVVAGEPGVGGDGEFLNLVGGEGGPRGARSSPRRRPEAAPRGVRGCRVSAGRARRRARGRSPARATRSEWQRRSERSTRRHGRRRAVPKGPTIRPRGVGRSAGRGASCGIAGRVGGRRPVGCPTRGLRRFGSDGRRGVRRRRAPVAVVR